MSKAMAEEDFILPMVNIFNQTIVAASTPQTVNTYSRTDEEDFILPTASIFNQIVEEDFILPMVNIFNQTIVAASTPQMANTYSQTIEAASTFRLRNSKTKSDKKSSKLRL